MRRVILTGWLILLGGWRLAACAPTAQTPYAPPTPAISHAAKVFEAGINSPAAPERIQDRARTSFSS